MQSIAPPASLLSVPHGTCAVLVTPSAVWGPERLCGIGLFRLFGFLSGRAFLPMTDAASLLLQFLIVSLGNVIGVSATGLVGLEANQEIFMFPLDSGKDHRCRKWFIASCASEQPHVGWSVGARRPRMN